MEWLKLVHGTAAPVNAQTIRPGDEVRVWFKIVEQGKERLGQFEGLVIRVRGSGPSKTFTVRRVTFGEGVERAFPFDAKMISRIEVLRKGRVKRARLYFLRTTIGKTRIPGAAPSVSSSTSPEASATPSSTAHAGVPVESPELASGASPSTQGVDRA